MAPTNRQATMSLAVMQFTLAFSIASLVLRLPSIQSFLNIGEGQLTTMTSMRGWGSILALVFIGYLSSIISIKRSFILYAFMFAVGYLALSGYVFEFGYIYYGLGMFLIGASGGALNMIVNGLASDLEAHSDIVILPKLHSLAPIGSLLGTATAGLYSFFELSPLVQYLTLGSLVLLVRLVAIKYLPAHAHNFDAEPDQPKVRITDFYKPLKHKEVLLAAFVLGLVVVWESGAIYWIPLYLVNEAQGTEAMSAIIVATYALPISLVRLAGNKYVNKYSAYNIVAASFAVAATGMLIFLNSPDNNYFLKILGAIIWGAGGGLSLPVMFRYIANVVTKKKISRTAKISAASLVSTFASITGPQVVGYTAQISSIYFALTCTILVVPVMGVIAYRDYKSKAAEASNIN